MIINSTSVLSSNSTKKPVKTWLVFRTVAFLMLLFIIPVENILSETIIHSQEDLVESIQDNYRTDDRDEFFKFMRYFGSDWVIIGASPLLFHIGDCRYTLKAILIICMSAYLNSVTALWQKEPRPFWLDSDIYPVICDLGYGNPSKETMIGVTFCATILIEFFHSFSIWIRVVAYSFVIMLQGLLGFSAIYLGVQFPHQVIMSCVISFVYLTACFAFDERLSEFVLKSGFSYSQNRFYIIYWIIGTVILLLIATVVFDFIALAPDDEMNLKWLKEAGVIFT